MVPSTSLYFVILTYYFFKVGVCAKKYLHVATPCDRGKSLFWFQSTHITHGSRRNATVHSFSAPQRSGDDIINLIFSFPHKSLNSRATPRNTSNISLRLSPKEPKGGFRHNIILTNSYTSSFAQAPVWDDRELRFFVRTLKKHYIIL